MGTVIVTVIVALFIGISIGALIIMLATKIAAGFGAKFGQAFLAALLANILGMVLGFILQMVLGAGNTASLVSLILFFLLNSAIINAFVKRPDGMQMGFGKACIVSLIEIVIFIILIVICFFIFGAGILAMIGGGMH
jgi:hypothetical protein